MTATISDLPPISPPLQTNDLLLVRRGTTDYQAAANIVQQVNVAELNATPSYSPNDLMMIWNLGTSQLYNIQYGQVGFPIGTMTWFYQNTVPVNWITVVGTGDRILACAEPALKYQSAPPVSGGAQGGTWQQYPVNALAVPAGTPGFSIASPGGIAGGGLSISQMPRHLHAGALKNNNINDIAGANSQFFQGGNISASPPTNLNTTLTGGTTGLGSCDPHDHGAVWRPAANVGKIGIKVT